jgi:2-phospho-L-lactate guanylyltransferase
VTAAIVPVKHLAAGKSRLAKALGRDGAERLALAMLEDVGRGAAWRARTRRDRRRDAGSPPSPRRPERAGARALLGADPGLNEAIDRAARELGEPARDGTLVVLGDVAGARAADLEAMLAALARSGAPCVVLAPARDGGTAAHARKPHGAIPSRFGADSAHAHRESARAAQVPLVELQLPSLAIDLDDEAALRAFLATAAGGERTRAALRALGVGMRVQAGPDPPVAAAASLPFDGRRSRRAAPRAALAAAMRLADGVLVVCQKIVSKAEGRIVRLADVEPSAEAQRVAAEDGKDPRHVEIVMRETARVVRHAHGVWIAETRHGFVCANAGVDLSNAPGEGYAVLLPEDPDASARRLRDALLAAGDGPLEVIISSTARAASRARARGRRDRLRQDRAALGLAQPHRSGQPHALESHQHGGRRPARGGSRRSADGKGHDGARRCGARIAR